MSSELETRVAALEAARNAGRRTHFIWIAGDDEAQAEAAIAARTAAGQIKPGDRVITFCWQAPGGPEAPMNPDPFGAGPRPAPPPSNPPAWSPGVALDLPSAQPPPWNDNFGGRISYFDGPWD